MTLAGWITMLLCWSFVTGFCVFLIIRTLRQPRQSCDQESQQQH